MAVNCDCCRDSIPRGRCGLGCVAVAQGPFRTHAWWACRSIQHHLLHLQGVKVTDAESKRKIKASTLPWASAEMAWSWSFVVGIAAAYSTA